MNIDLTAFIAICFFLAITPGPSVIYVVAYSLRYGSKAGIISTLGINAGSVFAILIAAFGLSTLLSIYPRAVNIIQGLGSVYVLYLAIRLWPKENTTHVNEVSLQEMSNASLFRNGFVTSILNPKDILFYTAFIPSFIETDMGVTSYRYHFLGLATIYMLMGLVTKSSFAIFSGYVRSLLESGRMKIMNYVSAISLGLVGLFLFGKSASNLFNGV